MKTLLGIVVGLLVGGSVLIGCAEDSVEIDGCGAGEVFQDGRCQQKPDAGYGSCYFKDPGLGLLGCPVPDACIPLKYWEACPLDPSDVRCGANIPDGCGQTYLCDCSSTSDGGTDLDAADDSN